MGYILLFGKTSKITKPLPLQFSIYMKLCQRLYFNSETIIFEPRRIPLEVFQRLFRIPRPKNEYTPNQDKTCEGNRKKDKYTFIYQAMSTHRPLNTRACASWILTILTPSSTPTSITLGPSFSLTTLISPLRARLGPLEEVPQEVLKDRLGNELLEPKLDHRGAVDPAVATLPSLLLSPEDAHLPQVLKEVDHANPGDRPGSLNLIDPLPDNTRTDTFMAAPDDAQNLLLPAPENGPQTCP